MDRICRAVLHAVETKATLVFVADKRQPIFIHADDIAAAYVHTLPTANTFFIINTFNRHAHPLLSSAARPVHWGTHKDNALHRAKTDPVSTSPEQEP